MTTMGRKRQKGEYPKLRDEPLFHSELTIDRNGPISDAIDDPAPFCEYG